VAGRPVGAQVQGTLSHMPMICAVAPADTRGSWIARSSASRGRVAARSRRSASSSRLRVGRRLALLCGPGWGRAQRRRCAEWRASALLQQAEHAARIRLASGSAPRLDLGDWPVRVGVAVAVRHPIGLILSPSVAISPSVARNDGADLCRIGEAVPVRSVAPIGLGESKAVRLCVRRCAGTLGLGQRREGGDEEGGRRRHSKSAEASRLSTFALCTISFTSRIASLTYAAVGSLPMRSRQVDATGGSTCAAASMISWPTAIWSVFGILPLCSTA
jgi:hypothetical protein